jgi:hypothetical protein
MHTPYTLTADNYSVDIDTLVQLLFKSSMYLDPVDYNSQGWVPQIALGVGEGTWLCHYIN